MNLTGWLTCGVGTVLVILVSNNTAFAVPFYLDTGVGASQIFPSSAFGLAFNLGALAEFKLEPGEPEIHLGIQSRLSNFVSEGNYYGVMAPYAVARVQWPNIFISGGASSLVWGSQSSSPSSNALNLIYKATSYFAEAGGLWPLIPTFSLGFSVAATFAKSNFIRFPAPVYDGTFFMRFFIGSLGGNGESDPTVRSEFKGWRYPYGRSR